MLKMAAPVLEVMGNSFTIEAVSGATTQIRAGIFLLRCLILAPYSKNFDFRN
jgi:hypothetical protein